MPEVPPDVLSLAASFVGLAIVALVRKGKYWKGERTPGTLVMTLCNFLMVPIFC